LYYVDAKEKTPTPKKSPTIKEPSTALSSPLEEDYILANEYPMEDEKKENDKLINELRDLLKKVKKVEKTGQEEVEQGTGQEEVKEESGQEEPETVKHYRSNPYSYRFDKTDTGIKIKKEEQKAKNIEIKISNFKKENEKKIKKEEIKLEKANIELENANIELENANIELENANIEVKEDEKVFNEVENKNDVNIYAKRFLIKKNMARRKTLVKLHQVRKLGRSIKIRGQLLVNIATDKQFTKTLQKSVRKNRLSSRIKKLNKNNRTQSMPNLLPRRPKVQILNEEPVYHPGQPVPVTARSTKKSLKSNRPVLMEVDDQGNAPIFNSQPKQQLSPPLVTQSVPMEVEEQNPQGKLNDFNLNTNTPFLTSQPKSRINPSLASQSVPMMDDTFLSRPYTRKGN
jgi:hypothetical protein